MSKLVFQTLEGDDNFLKTYGKNLRFFSALRLCLKEITLISKTLLVNRRKAIYWIGKPFFVIFVTESGVNLLVKVLFYLVLPVDVDGFPLDRR